MSELKTRPFCGKRLVPLIKGYECVAPEPPKERE